MHGRAFPAGQNIYPRIHDRNPWEDWILAAGFSPQPWASRNKGDGNKKETFVDVHGASETMRTKTSSIVSDLHSTAFGGAATERRPTCD